MLPRIIVSVLDSSDARTDVAAAWASSLARWYDADLHHVDVDKSVREIARYGRRVGADLVVVSNRARRGRGYWRTGSFAAALGAAVTSPTLVVPGEATPPGGQSSPFRTILSAIDFSDVSVRALSEALHLVQQSGGRLRLLHVMTAFPHETVYGGSDALRLGRAFRASATRIGRELQALIPPPARHWSEVDSATVLGEADEVILEQASRGRADLIVLGLPRRSRLAALVAGSTAPKVLRRATSPVLLVPGPVTPPRIPLAEARASGLAAYPAAAGVRGVEGGEVTTSWR